MSSTATLRLVNCLMTAPRAPVFGVPCGVGEVVVPLVDIALFATDEVVETGGDDDVCMELEDRLGVVLVVSSIVEEPSVDEVAADGGSPKYD